MRDGDRKIVTLDPWGSPYASKCEHGLRQSIRSNAVAATHGSAENEGRLAMTAS